MQHLVGFYESVDQGAALAEIAAMSDQALNTDGDNVTVPTDMAFLLGAVALTAATTRTAAQIRAPSLQTLAYQEVSLLVNGATFANPTVIDWYGGRPRALAGNEDFQFLTNTDNGGAVAIYGFAWLGDGPVTPDTRECFTVKATAAATLAAGTWVNSNLTFDQTLPVGNYDVVGLKVRSANGIASRLSFIGGGYRPGVPCVNTMGELGWEQFRFGKGGVLGSFSSTALPSLDVLGVTDTAQDVFLDLVKTS